MMETEERYIMKKYDKKAGFTLVEVLISALIIAILVIGGAATLYYTSSNIQITGNKRIALQVANQRLELAKANSYYDIAPPDYDVADTYFLTADNTDPHMLVLQRSKQQETIELNDASYTLVTEVIRHSQDSVSVDFNPECLEIIATVIYREGTGESVELSTLILHPEVAN